MFAIEAVTSFEDFLRLEPVWNETLARSDNDILFMTFEWFSCWWRSYGGGNEMFVLVVRADGEVVAIAPLMKTRTRLRGMPLTAVSLMANCHSERSGFIMARADGRIVAAVLDYLNAAGLHSNLLFFDYLVRDSNTERSLKAAFAAYRMPYVEHQGDSSPYIVMEGTWEQFLKKHARAAREVRRIGRKYGQEGEYEIVRRTGKECAKGFEELLEISRRTWKYREGTAIASSVSDTQFYRSLAEAGGEGWLNLWILRFRGKPIGFAYFINYKNRLYGLKMGFDDEYGSLSPCKLIVAQALKYCFEQGMIELDLLGKKDPYKMMWTGRCRDHCRYHVFTSSVWGTMLYLMESKLVPIVKQFVGKRSIPAHGAAAAEERQ